VAAESTFDTIRPDFVPSDATDRAHDVNLNWRQPHFEQPTRIRNRLRAEAIGRKSEHSKGRQQASRVVECRANQDVDVTGEARDAMEGQSVGSDDELNPMGSHGADKLVEVGRQFHRPASAGIRLRQRALPGAARASSVTRATYAPLRPAT
jgi:hypothetical protein